MDEKEQIEVRCYRVSEFPSKASPSAIHSTCDRCSEAVWLDQNVLAEIHRRYPDADVETVCIRCGNPDDAEIHYTAAQVHDMRALGYTDEMIAEWFALAKISDGTATLNEMAERIRGGDRLLARRFVTELTDAARFVTGVLRSN